MLLFSYIPEGTEQLIGFPTLYIEATAREDLLRFSIWCDILKKNNRKVIIHSDGNTFFHGPNRIILKSSKDSAVLGEKKIQTFVFV